MDHWKSEVRFTGHVITKEGLQPDPEKVKAVLEMPKPTSKEEFLSLLGFVNYLSSSSQSHQIRGCSATERDYFKGSEVHLVPVTLESIPGSARACSQTLDAQI